MNRRRPSEQTLAVVGALLHRCDAWRYGYDLCQELDLASGTLYPILIRLTERGYLETRWSTPEGTGRPRHLYRLTGSGRAWAADVLQQAAMSAGTQPRLRRAEGQV